MHRIILATVMALSFFSPGIAWAQTLWVCALSEEAVQLVCVADPDPTQVAEPAAVTSAVFRGTVFPLNHKRMYTVELWSPPTEMAFVEELARSTICFRSPGCSIIMPGERWAAAMPRAWMANRTAIVLR
jgi:hypothetical protein